MPDITIAIVFWLSGAIFMASVLSAKERSAQAVALAGVTSLVGALALVFLLGVTFEVLQETNVSRLVDMVADAISVGDRREKVPVLAVPEPTPIPTPAPTPFPDDISAPADARPPNWLLWLLYTDEES